MSPRTLLACLTLLSLAFAGCTTPEEGAGDGGLPPTPTTQDPVNGTTPTPTSPTPPSPPVGGTGGNDTDDGGLPYNYTLIIEGVPATAAVNETFTFTLNITGGPASNSTYVGAHYDDDGNTTPIASEMHMCEVFEAGAPGNHTITCAIDTPGTWYVRGHYRLTEDGRTEDYWSAPLVITVS
jgi:predicted secreted protein